MPTRQVQIAELIRRVLDGNGHGAAKRKLVLAGAASVEPILEAVSGGHGRLHSDRTRDGVNDLISALEKIAQRQPQAITAALAEHVPATNLAVWALGHSSSPMAKRALRSLVDHEDNGIRSVAKFHLERSARPTAQRRAPARKA